MENKEIVEVAETVVENRGSTAANVAILGGAMILGAVLWNKALKPLGRAVKKQADKVRKPKVKNEIDGVVTDAVDAVK